MLVHVEVALEDRIRSSPRIAGVRVAGCDICRCGATGEEPDLDEIRCPFRSVDTSVGGVETRSEGEALSVSDLAARVHILPWRVDVAVWSDQLTREIGAIFY